MYIMHSASWLKAYFGGVSLRGCIACFWSSSFMGALWLTALLSF